jgi:hypothetical protein
MSRTGQMRGHRVHFDGVWRYEDGTPAPDDRPCTRCGEPPTPEGYDACLGYIEGARSACCGHGVTEPYILPGLSAAFWRAYQDVWIPALMRWGDEGKARLVRSPEGDEA